jgi:hypothetical protein
MKSVDPNQSNGIECFSAEVSELKVALARLLLQVARHTSYRYPEGLCVRVY